MEGKKAYFLSDLHLGAPYFENSLDRERRVVRFLDSISESAEEIFLLGDVLDYWYEYRYVVPKGFVRFFGKLAELADRGVSITWLIGNHDIWIFDYIPRELGVTVADGLLDRYVMGTRMVMEHGDGVWQRDLKFKVLRRIFRNKLCQKMFAAIHPRWTIPFAHNWSGHSRMAGAPGMDTGPRGVNGRKAKNVYGLPDNIRHLHSFCEDYKSLNPDVRYFLFGHLHQIAREKVGENGEMLIIGDWLTHYSYAEFDGENMVLRHFER